MARTTAQALDYLHDLLIHPETGVNVQLGSIEARDGVILERVPESQVTIMNLPADLADQALDSAYPAIWLFAEEAENLNREKFAYFSGPLRLGLEMRLTTERPERLEPDLHRYVEAVMNVLQASCGEWSSGLVYGGRFAARYSPARLGGANFLQVAHLVIALEQHI